MYYFCIQADLFVWTRSDKFVTAFICISLSELILFVFLPRCMECRRGLAMRELSVRQTREL